MLRATFHPPARAPRRASASIRRTIDVLKELQALRGGEAVNGRAAESTGGSTSQPRTFAGPNTSPATLRHVRTTWRVFVPQLRAVLA